MSFLNGATVGYDTVNNKAVFVDQTLLPSEYREISTDCYEEMFEAVKTLKVRGAPAIGVFAGICTAVLINKIETEDYNILLSELERICADFVKCRPTAVNLKWALEKMLDEGKASSSETLKQNLKTLALRIIEDDISVCRKIGEYGAKLLKEKNAVLTHCNAGRLAAVKYGTALAPVYIAQEQGHGIKVYADETRPLLQGARLTAFELVNAGVDTTLICDNTASAVMAKGLVDAVLVGCDRVAKNGDTANKIGTSSVAILAKHYGIPFYVCMPFSTFDFSLKDGSEIIIEEREAAEVTDFWYKERMAPKGVVTLNYAFDVTPSSLITAFITEKGVITPSEIRNYISL
ncbi:MAG: S-methyl-5-thioribose-1-phosphate isomerase [Oscillospiraceae bacterium]|nr:S-methyl-5-thioribose-1-phosphate isomerase [Oscillospiraceae bacterium]